jgi:8-oxo-dGTP pyrophosphatase MutT (NUDIX family)
MKTIYKETLIIDGKKHEGDQKMIYLPFGHVSSRAVIIRRIDGAILGALHRPEGKYAFPGGALDDSESAEEALVRELEEEGINLMGNDQNWQKRLGVDYYNGYNELCLWYLFLVDGVEFKRNDELLDIRWISQDEDPWYPGNREKALIWMRQYCPEMIQE